MPISLSFQRKPIYANYLYPNRSSAGPFQIHSIQWEHPPYKYVLENLVRGCLTPSEKFVFWAGESLIITITERMARILISFIDDKFCCSLLPLIRVPFMGHLLENEEVFSKQINRGPFDLLRKLA